VRFQDDPAVQHWISRMGVNTVANRIPVLKGFFKQIDMTPSEAVAWQRAHPSDYKLLDLAFKYFDSDVHLGIASKRGRFYGIRGFFRKNRASMPYDDTPRFHSEKPMVNGHISIEELRKLLLSCNPMYRTVFLMMFQGGMGSSELLYVNVTHAEYIRRMVGKGDQVIKLDLPGRKLNKNMRGYYTFIGSDTVDSLRTYWQSQGWKPDKVLFRAETGQPLSRSTIHAYFREHMIRSGLVQRLTPSCLDCQGDTVKHRKVTEGKIHLTYICRKCGGERPCSDYSQVFNHHVRGGMRYGKNPHELRDLFLTEWHRSGADLAAGNFMMGHTIDPLGYDKIMHDDAYGREQFRNAMPFLNILSENPRVVPRSEVESELGELQREVKKMKQDYERVVRLLAKAVVSK